MNMIITPDENPFGHGNSIVDTRSAVLLDDTTVVMLDNSSDGRTIYGLQLAGRVNRSSARTNVLYLLDEDGAAAIVTELIGLFSRAGSTQAAAFQAAIDTRLANLPTTEKRD